MPTCAFPHSLHRQPKIDCGSILKPNRWFPTHFPAYSLPIITRMLLILTFIAVPDPPILFLPGSTRKQAPDGPRRPCWCNRGPRRHPVPLQPLPAHFSLSAPQIPGPVHKHCAARSDLQSSFKSTRRRSHKRRVIWSCQASNASHSAYARPNQKRAQKRPSKARPASATTKTLECVPHSPMLYVLPDVDPAHPTT